MFVAAQLVRRREARREQFSDKLLDLASKAEASQIERVRRGVDAIVAGDYESRSTPSCPFENADFNAANFSAADLTDTTFINTDLTSANFDGAVLVHTFFIGSDLRFASFVTSTGSPIFSETDLRSANIDPAEWNSVRVMNNSDCSFAKFTASGLRTIIMSDSICTDANFVLIDGTAARFESMEMQRANFDRAILTGCSFPFSNLTNANFVNAVITRCNFAFADLTGATFEPGAPGGAAFAKGGGLGPVRRRSGVMPLGAGDGVERCASLRAFRGQAHRRRARQLKFPDGSIDRLLMRPNTVLARA